MSTYLERVLEVLKSGAFVENKGSIYRLKKSLKTYENDIYSLSLEFVKNIQSLKVFVDKVNIEDLSADYIEELSNKHQKLDVYFIISLKPRPYFDKSYRSYNIGTLFSLDKFV